METFILNITYEIIEIKRAITSETRLARVRVATEKNGLRNEPFKNANIHLKIFIPKKNLKFMKQEASEI